MVDNLDDCPPDYYTLEDGSVRFYTAVGTVDQNYKHDWIWTTKEGTKVRVEDMSTSHIKNCLKQAIRNNPITNIYEAMLEELIKRNEL